MTFRQMFEPVSLRADTEHTPANRKRSSFNKTF